MYIYFIYLFVLRFCTIWFYFMKFFFYLNFCHILCLIVLYAFKWYNISHSIWYCLCTCDRVNKSNIKYECFPFPPPKNQKEKWKWKQKQLVIVLISFPLTANCMYDTQTCVFIWAINVKGTLILSLALLLEQRKRQLQSASNIMKLWMQYNWKKNIFFWKQFKQFVFI